MGLKSGFERTLATFFKSNKIRAEYEVCEIPYVLERNYRPDFFLRDYGFYIEAKGLLDREAKAKMLAVKKQHPDLDIRFVFYDADKRIPGTKQTHGEWATKNGFIWSSKEVPFEWLQKKVQ
jgi:hypothetical protein